MDTKEMYVRLSTGVFSLSLYKLVVLTTDPELCEVYPSGIDRSIDWTAVTFLEDLSVMYVWKLVADGNDVSKEALVAAATRGNWGSSGRARTAMLCPSSEKKPGRAQYIWLY